MGQPPLSLFLSLSFFLSLSLSIPSPFTSLFWPPLQIKVSELRFHWSRSNCNKNLVVRINKAVQLQRSVEIYPTIKYRDMHVIASASTCR